ncbi:MAG TPA: metallophosphoesterase [Bacillota bacterium]|nr:metallophosphoesterase [Bacillota bacterium]
MARLYEESKAVLFEKAKAVKNPSEFSFVVMGDSWAGDGETSNAILTEAFREARKHHPLFILHSGDSVFTGTVEQFQTGRDYKTASPVEKVHHVKSFRQLVDQYLLRPDPNKVGKEKIPIFVVPGNHEENGFNGPFDNFVKLIGPTNFMLNIPRLKLSLIGMKNVFRTQQNGMVTTKYGFTKGELELLRKYLRQRQKYTFLGMHTPPHAGKWSNPNYFTEAESTFKIGLQSFLNTIKGKVSKVFVGHVHAYDRAIIQDIEYILSGGTGAPLVKLGFLSSKSKVAKEAFHIVVITVKDGKISQRFIPIGWTA